MEEVFKEALNLLNKGEPFVIATVIGTKGSTPQKPGAKLLVREDGTGVGTLGGGCVEGDIWFAASRLLKDGGEPTLTDYELNEDIAAREGLVCGGTMYFLIDPVFDPASALQPISNIVGAYDGSRSVGQVTLLKPSLDTGKIGDKLYIGETLIAIKKWPRLLKNLPTTVGSRPWSRRMVPRSSWRVTLSQPQ
jgi:xanthine/CO dehydrogenase XdhC/CoxF family maturation factor